MSTLLNSCSNTKRDILPIIKLLDPNKSHGCDNISIKMIAMGKELLTLPLKMIFAAFLIQLYSGQQKIADVNGVIHKSRQQTC